MDFLKNVADSVTKAVDFVVDKNRRAAMINRLKIVIKSEKEKQLHAYAELGKYYYNNMRDSENEETEKACAVIENSSRRLSRALAKLDEITADDSCYDDEDDENGTCGDDGGSCACGDDCTCEQESESCKCDEDAGNTCCGEYSADGSEKKCCGFDENEDYGETAPESEPYDSYEGFPHICKKPEDTGSGEAADDDNPPFKP